MEIVLKAAGALFVLGSSSYFAVTLNAGIDRREAQLRQLYSVLLQLKSEIQYMNNPLPVCFEKMGKEENPPFNRWFLNMSHRMEGEKKQRFHEVWEEETGHLYETSSLQKQDVEPLLVLKDKLGSPDVKAQIKALDYALLQLEHNRNHLEEEMKQKKKVIMSLSLFVGFITVILFI